MKVVVIDDDKLIAMSLKTIIEGAKSIEVVAIGYSGEKAIDLYEEYMPDVILMDIRMGGVSGLEAAKEILKKHNNAKVLFLTTFEDDEYIITALNLGAKGYILKQHFEGIVPALKAVYGGQSVFGQEVVSKLPSILNRSINKKTTVKFELSERELDIIKYVSEGLSNREISVVLFLSEGTVRNYISNILDKLQLRDRTQLAIFYFNNLR